MKHSILVMTIALAGLSVSPVNAGEWDITGFVGVDTRTFWQEAAFDDQASRVDASLLLQPEFYWNNDDQRVSIVGFARADLQDSERSHADLRQAYWAIERSSWDLVLGLDKVFWGVTESRHLVDVINQTDLVEDIDGEAKLGQPMLNLNIQRDYGRFGLFVLPYFRERTFPGAAGRLRTPLPVDTDNPEYESTNKEQHVDYAFRYSHYLGDLDIGIHWFDGTSRESRFQVSADGNRLIPIYDLMTQTGIDLQYTRDAWLWKLEAISRDTRVDSFAAVAAGFEYTLYGVRESAIDVGLLFEYLYDGRDAASPPTPFDDDVFIGTRIALNDAEDTSLLAGIAVDLDNQETFLNIEAERRFGDSIVAEFRLRAFANAATDGALLPFAQDDYAELRLSWYY